MTIRNIWRIVAFFIACSLSLNGLAATYYVASGGSDGVACTSVGAPCASLSGAIGKAANGDTIYVNRGDTFTPTATTTISKTLTIDAYGSGDRPIFDGQMTYPVDTAHYSPLIKITADNVTLRNIEVRNTNGHGINVDQVSGTTLYRVKTNQTYMVGIIIYKADNTQVIESEVVRANWGWKNDPNYPYTVMGSALSFKTSTNNVARGNTIGPGWGEGINAWYGSDNSLFEYNVVHGQRNIGIYNEFSSNSVIRYNIITGTTDTQYHRSSGYVGGCLVINNERDASPGSADMTSKNIQVYGNMITGCLSGVSLWAQFKPTHHVNMDIINNTIVDTAQNLQLVSGTDISFEDIVIANNIFAKYETATVQAQGTLPAGVTMKNNTWIGGAPPASYSGTGDVTSGGLLTKTSGWNAISSVTGVSVADFTPATGSTSIGAGTTSLLGFVMPADINGTAQNSPPDTGAIVNGSASTPVGGAEITAVSPTSLTESTAGYSVAGNELSGVVSVVATDGVDTEALLNILPTADGTGFAFDTGALTGIDLATASIVASYKAPTLISHNPRTWTVGSITRSDYTTVTGPYSNSIRAASAGATWNRTFSPTVSVSSSDVVDLEVDYSAGTSTKVVVYGELSVSTDISYGGSVASSHSGLTPADRTGITYSREALSNGIYRSKLNFTSAAAQTVAIGIGPYTTTSGQDVIVHGGRIWVNRGTLSEVSYSFGVPFEASITNLNSDNVIDPINAANGENLFALSGSIGVASIPVTTPNASGSVATFKSPDISALAVGSHTLTLNVAQPVDIDQTPTAWTTNSANVTVTPYVGTHLGYGGGATLTVGAGGADWAGFKVDSVFSVAAGDQIEQWFDVVQGVGGQVRASITNETAGGYLDYKGIFGALASSGSTACSTSSVSETVSDGMVRLKLNCTSLASGTYRVALTANSAIEGDSVHVLGRATFVNAVPVAKTLTVTKAGDVVVPTETTKKFVWSEANGHSIECYNATANTLTPYTGNMAVKITDGDYFAPSPAVNELAYAPTVAFVSGEAEMVESDLNYGSINVLLTGDHGYNYWATNGTCRADNAIELIAE